MFCSRSLCSREFPAEKEIGDPPVAWRSGGACVTGLWSSTPKSDSGNATSRLVTVAPKSVGETFVTKCSWPQYPWINRREIYRNNSSEFQVAPPLRKFRHLENERRSVTVTCGRWSCYCYRCAVPDWLADWMATSCWAPFSPFTDADLQLTDADHCRWADAWDFGHVRIVFHQLDEAILFERFFFSSALRLRTMPDRRIDGESARLLPEEQIPSHRSPIHNSGRRSMKRSASHIDFFSSWFHLHKLIECKFFNLNIWVWNECPWWASQSEFNHDAFAHRLTTAFSR